MNKIDSDAVYIYEHGDGRETAVLFSDELAVAWYNVRNKPTTEETCLKNI